MNKLPKFLLAKNEMANHDQFIIHTQEPSFVAKVVKTNALELLDLQKEYFVTVNKGDSIGSYNIGAQTRVDGQLYAIFVIKFLSEPDLSGINETGSGGLMSRMGDWWHAYCKNLNERNGNV